MLNQPLPLILSFNEPLTLCQSIRFESVSFCYGYNSSQVLKCIDVEIHRGERIGLIGNTGSGKSTMMDIVMGLLVPASGRFLVDGVDIHDPQYPERLIAWRSSIAHVPQNIFLSDSSIAENIAFGVPRDHIDLDRVKWAAHQAKISDFIEDRPDAYNSFVGERGIRLSGGQKQRLGIARALYKKAQILILDEATSALDTVTEEAVMESINCLAQDLTILMIAHRLSTVQRCDRLIHLADGLLVADGPPSDVFETL